MERLVARELDVVLEQGLEWVIAGLERGLVRVVAGLERVTAGLGLVTASKETLSAWKSGLNNGLFKQNGPGGRKFPFREWL